MEKNAVKVSIVVGNPKPRSRTLKIAEVLVDKLFETGTYDLEVIDLADHTTDIFAWPSEEMSELNERVATSDLAIFASPTYKASYTGLLKAFLDRYPANGLHGVVAIPVMTGGDLTHAMGGNVNLAPLLVELGAVVPGNGLYFVASQMDHVDEIVATAAAGYAANFARVGSLSVATRPASVSQPTA